MPSDIAVVENKITLPSPKNEAAEFAIKRMDVVFSALGSMADRNMFAASAIIAINELSQACSMSSVMKAVLGAAYLQLPFGSALGFAYLLPFKGNATLCIGYQGFQELGMRSNFLTDVHADVVCDGEDVQYFKDETGPRLKHFPDMDRDPSRKNIVAAYCIYHTSSGGRGIRFVPRKEIDKVDKGKDVWNSNFPAMCMKTAIRRAAKEWRKTPQLAYAVEADELSEREESNRLPPNVIESDISEEAGKKPGWTPPTE